MAVTYFILLAAIFNLVFGFIVLRSNYRNPINASFAIFSFLMSIWVFLNFILQTYHSFDLLRSIFAIGPFITIAAIIWIHFLRGGGFSTTLKYFIIISLLSSFLLTFLIFSGATVISNIVDQFNFEVGPGFAIYAIFLSVLFLIFIGYTIHAYLQGEDQLKSQLKYVFAGLLTLILVIVVVDLILPLLGYSQYNVFDSPSSVIFVLLSGQAVLRYRLFDLKVAATELLVLGLWFVLLAKIFIAESLTAASVDIFVLILSVFFGILLIRSVIAEIKRKEQISQLAGQLKIANDHLKELDKMKTEFVTLASHELLTPISAIEGYLSMLLDEKIVDPQSTKGIEYLHRIYGASKRLAKLVTDLLNVSRIEEGRLLIQNKSLDINQIIDTVVGELKFKASKRKLELNWQAGEWPAVYADSDKLKEIIVNLVGNSIKYTQEGSITINVEMLPSSAIKAIDFKQQEFLRTPVGDEALSHHIEQQRRVLVGDKQLVVNVTDTGIGIPSEEISNVFRKFYRIGDITTVETQGTGLGLYISRSLAEMMHGRMWVKSLGRGKGSTFSFSLPLAAYEPQIKLVEKDIKISEVAKPLAHSSQFEL